MYTILDLYCGAGGASAGYYDAGFDVVGVDRFDQYQYPFDFVKSDALAYVAANGWRFDAIHASPPCQAHTWSAARWRNSGEQAYPDLLPQTRYWLQTIGKPYVIENVIGAPMHNPLVLCGEMFGLRVFRHRQFESNVYLFAPGRACSHAGKSVGFDDDSFVTVAGHGGDGSGKLVNWQAAMGIDWMDKSKITQAIPPAYTEFIGRQLIRHLDNQQAAPADTFCLLDMVKDAS